MSADQLAANGIRPGDPRVQRIFAECAQQASGPVETSSATQPAGPYIPDFVIDGLRLGGAVFPDSQAYKAYTCRPSDQFPGFTWCAVKHPMVGKSGPYNSWITILHSNANAAVFIEQQISPAFFGPGEVQREIQRLSQYFGRSARVLNGDPRPNAQHTVIATWGDVILTPLDDPTMELLRRNETITAGLVVDFLNDAKRSAKEGMPVYHMGGGAGYVWTAKFDESGRGTLSVSAINADALPDSAAPATPSAPAVAAAASPAAVPDPVQAETDKVARADRVIGAAKAQLEDAEAFIREHPQSPRLLEFVELISTLSNAVKGANPDDIERRSELAQEIWTER
jgi:hypothetical protein